MNKSEREELKRLAEAATPGKWSTDICQIDKSWLKGRLQNCVINPSGVVAVVSESDPDAAFIAAANPAAIQSLLAEFDRLEAQRDRLLSALKDVRSDLADDDDTSQEYLNWLDEAITEAEPQT